MAKTKKTIKEDLADIIKTDINAVFQKDQGFNAAYFLDGTDINPAEITDWVSTGCDVLDMQISNRRNGGLPVGRIIEYNGLESCVTEDTIVELDNGKKIQIKEIEDLLKVCGVVKVKSRNNKYVKVKEYVNKGIKETFKVTLENGAEQKVAENHKFFTNHIENGGWARTSDLISDDSKILFDDNEFYTVKYIEFIGVHPIVDIMIDEDNYDDQCYFGNGMLNHNTGKTLFCASALAITQQKGGVPVFIDSESSISADFMKALGIKFDVKNKMIYIQLDTVEDAFATVDNIIRIVRENSETNKIVTIILDSLAGLSTKVEMEDDFDQAGYATQKAIIISKAMRKLTNMIAREKILFVFTNQLRVKIGAMWGDKFCTSGGKAPAFHSSVRLRLTNVGQVKDANKKNIGMQAEAKVIKNRIGPPMKICKFNIFYDSGIDNDGCTLTTLKDLAVIKGTKAKYTYVDTETGEKLDFSEAEFRAMMKTSPEFKEKIMVELGKYLIDEYKPRDLAVEEIEVTDEIEDD